MSTMIITFEHKDVMRPRPWPVAIGADNEVLSGLGPDDGATLVGFGPAGEQTITIFPETVREAPEAAIGLTPTFSKDEGLFLWNQVVAEVGIGEAVR